MAAGSLAGVLDCKHRKIALLKAKVAKEDLAFECLQISMNCVFKSSN